MSDRKDEAYVMHFWMLQKIKFFNFLKLQFDL